jgi:predicted HTH domain antitoxin
MRGKLIRLPNGEAILLEGNKLIIARRGPTSSARNDYTECRRGGRNMTLTLPDDVVKQTGLTEREILIELACRLFDAGKLYLWPAAQVAGLSRVEMEGELIKRKIKIYRPTVEDLAEELAGLDRLGI